MNKWWVSPLVFVGGCVLAMVLICSVPVAAQSPTPNAFDALATQSALSQQSTAQAIDQANRAANAQAQAAQAAAQATHQAAANQASLAAAQATLNAALLQMTVAAEATRSAIQATQDTSSLQATQTHAALEVEQTRDAMDELDRQRALMATAQAASAQATATRQVIEATTQSQTEAIVSLGVLILLLIVLGVALYAGSHIAQTLKAWAIRLRPRPAPVEGIAPVNTDGTASITIDAQPRPSSTSSLPPVIVVDRPGAVEAIKTVLRGLPPDQASDPDYFQE